MSMTSVPLPNPEEGVTVTEAESEKQIDPELKLELTPDTSTVEEVSSKGRKFPSEYENPLDEYILQTGRPLYSLYRWLQLTPNHLTTISFVLGLASVYCFYKKMYVLSAILYFVSYCYDCFDGNYARTYKLVSEFGDYYDHIKDVVVAILLLGVVLKYSPIKNPFVIGFFFTGLVLFVLGMYIHLGCQEIYVKEADTVEKKDDPGSEKSSTFLSTVTRIIMVKPQPFMNNLKIIRYFGTGSLIAWIVLFIALQSVLKNV